MTLAAGDRLGLYEVLAPIGAGGMGEVYRARDPRLGREVAIKVLPASFSQDADRLRRFEQEARVLASLNHPHVATIHGLEESGSVRALVMELVEGETLTERIARGPIPLEEALPIAREITEALEYAHEKGIVHRDLKPANVMLTAEGRVKLLDFGLAKALESDPGAGADLSHSPTYAGPATQEGVVLGTAAYLAPEQAKGKPVDRRADIWAFGCVLYEMLSGQRAFGGATGTETLAALMRDEPQWAALPRSTPTVIRRLLERCLTKDPTRRLQAIGEARIELAEVASKSTPASVVTTRRPPRRGIVLLAIGLVLLAGIGIWYLSSRSKGGGSPHSGGAAAANLERSIAVLPFRNLSGDAANDYFSDGVSEEILNALTRLPGVKVIGRTSSFRFRGPAVDASAVGKDLQVGTILAGSVQRVGDAVRVTAELVDTRTGYQLWSQKYDRKLQNLFELEDEISRAISEALRVELAGGAARPMVSAATTSPEAHNLVLRANAAARRSDEASLNDAVRLYREALTLDPRYAAAWSGMVLAYAWLADAYRAPREVVPLAREAAEQAIAIDESFAAGHQGLGVVDLLWDWNFPAARKEIERALALDPGVGFTHANYGLLLGAVDGDLARSRAEFEKAAALDPLNPGIPWFEVLAAIGRRDYADALRHAARVRKIDPDFFYFMDSTAMVHMAMARWADCVADHKELPEAVRSQPQYGLAICLAHLGAEKEAREILGRLKVESRSRYVDASSIAGIYAALGQRDEAFALLDRAVQDRSGNLPYIEWWPEFDPLRSDPRYAELLARIGLRPPKK
jgi:eukaryotic-like serine/threonine-protein kinase